MMSDPPTPEERVSTLLSEAQQQLQRELQHSADQGPSGQLDLQGLSRRIDEALSLHQQHLDAQPSAVEDEERVTALERELRFAMGLMALLFFTGVWGFWRGALYDKPKMPSSGGSGAAASAGGPMGTRPFVPKPQLPMLKRSKPTKARLSKQALMPRAVLKPSKLLRPAFRKKKRKQRSVAAFAPPGVKARQLPRVKAPQRRRLARRAARRRRAQRLRLQRRRRALRRARRKLRRTRFALGRRRLRFGDPALPSEVPPQWCGKRLRYGPYFPCLKRRGRRCIKRSKRRKYGCLRKRRR